MNQTIKNLLVTGGTALIVSVGGVTLLTPEEVIIAPNSLVTRECQVIKPVYLTDFFDRTIKQSGKTTFTVIGLNDIENEILSKNWEKECDGLPVMTKIETDEYRAGRILDMDNAIKKLK